MFSDFEERFSPKCVDDIVFANDDARGLVGDLITGARPFPIKEGKCGILLYGVNGTGKSALAKLLPDAIERARGGEQAFEMYVRVQSGSNGMSLIQRITNKAMLMPFERADARKSASKRSSGKSKAKPAPPKRLPPPLQHVTAPAPKADEKTTSANKPQAHNAQPPNAQQAQPTAKPELSTAPAALPTQQKAVGMAQPQPTATNPQAAHLQQPQATQLPLTPQQQRLQRQNVGYLAKNSAVTKRM